MFGLDISSIVASPWFAIFTFVVGLLVAVALHYINKKVKGLSYTVRSFDVIKNNITEINKVEILFKGEKISNLSVSNKAIWNSGNITIDGNDIAKKEPLHLWLGAGDTLLDYRIMSEKNSANGFSLTEDRETFVDTDTEEPLPIIKVDFDYIDPNEGLVVQIYHTSIDEPYISLNGAIKGIPKVQRVFESNQNLLSKWFSDNRYGLTKLMLMALIINVFLFFPAFIMVKGMVSGTFSPISEWTVVLIMILFNFLVVYRILVKGKTPKGFEILEKGL